MFSCFLFLVLGVEQRAWYLLGKCSLVKLSHQSCLVVFLRLPWKFLYSSGYPQFIIFLFPPPRCWDCRNMLSCLVFLRSSGCRLDGITRIHPPVFLFLCCAGWLPSTEGRAAMGHFQRGTGSFCFNSYAICQGLPPLANAETSPFVLFHP